MLALVLQAFISMFVSSNFIMLFSYAQTFLVFLVLDDGADPDISHFASWLQFTKLDFGFVNSVGLNLMTG